MIHNYLGPIMMQKKGVQEKSGKGLTGDQREKTNRNSA